MKALFTMTFLLASMAFAQGVLVAIPEGADPAVAAQLAAKTAASTGESVVVTDLQTGEKAEAKVDANAKPKSFGEWVSFNFKLETGNQAIDKGPPLHGSEKFLPGVLAFVYFGGEASVKEWVNVSGYVGAPGGGVALDVQPLKFFAPGAPVHGYKLQPMVGYKWFWYDQLGTTGSKEPGQLYKRQSSGLTWGVNYALTSNTKLYVQGGSHTWNEQYFVEIYPWNNGPAQTRSESKKRGTVFVGISLNLNPR